MFESKREELVVLSVLAAVGYLASGEHDKVVVAEEAVSLVKRIQKTVRDQLSYETKKEV